MALADTAALIASLELQDKFSSTVSKYDKAVAGMQQKSNTLDKVGFQIGRGARNAVDNIGRIAVVGAGLVASQVALGVRSLTQLAEVQNQTEAVIKSTGGAANVTTDQIRTMAESLEDLTTIDDKAIQAGQNILLTFTNIRNEAGKGNDIFNQATEAVLDLSVAMGTEPKNAALQLGKALNDPVRGLTALRRVGIQFTDEQEKQIAKMVEAGDKLGAQKVIIAELNKEFGKSAEAFGQGPGATMRRFGDAVEGAQQALATGFLPVMERVSELVQDTLKDPKVLANIKSFGEGLAGGVEDLISIGTKLPWDAIGNSAKLMGQGAKALLDAFTGLPPWIQTAVLTGWGLNKLTGGALGNIAGTLTGALAKGLFNGRGSTAFNPVFTKEVGVPGGGGGPTPGGGGIGGFLLKATVFGAVAFGIAEGLGELQQVLAPGAREAKDAFAAANPFFGSKGKPVPVDIVATHTPLGQFNAANQGGTPAPTGLPKGSGASNSVTIAVQKLHKDIQAALARGDIHAARLLKEQVDALRGLDNRSEKRNNQIVAGLGRTHAALSVANRNLQEGNSRQREMKAGIDAVRSSTNTGFSRTNANLGVTNSRLSTIAAKDFSPNVAVTVPVSNYVSISEVTRVATSTAFASGFTPRLLNG